MMKRRVTDKLTTTASLGYTICGFCKKEPTTGQTIESQFKIYPAKSHIPDVFHKVFSQGGGFGSILRLRGSDTGPVLYTEGVKVVMKELYKMLHYFKNVNVHEIRGSSLLIVIDPLQSIAIVKIIDLSSMRPLVQVEGYDGVSRD